MDPSQLLTWLLGAASALALAGAVGWTAWLGALALLPTARPSARWAAAATLALWELLALFAPLLALGAFRLAVALPLLLVIALGAHLALARRTAPLARLREDVQALRAALTELPTPLRWAGGVAALVVLVRLARGLASPPTAADALAYHLYKAGVWVQTGRDALEAAPDAWDYYNHFPAAGDALWAWAMLPYHADTLVAGASALLWALGGLGAYAAARALGAGRPGAVGAALALACLPAALATLTVCYVDDTVLACWLLSLTFFFRAMDRPSLGDVLLALAAMACMVAVKASLATGFALLGLALALRALWPTRGGPRLRLTWLLAGAAVALPPMAGLLTSWVRFGSPLYPFALTLGPLSFPGDEELGLVLQGLVATPVVPSLGQHLANLFGLQRAVHDSDVLGFGPGAVLMAGLAIPGGIALVRARGARTAWLLVAPCLALALLLLSLGRPDALALRTGWYRLLPRLLLVIPGTVALLAALPTGRRVAWIWVLVLAGDLACALPRGWRLADLPAMLEILPVLLAVAGVPLALAWRRPRPGVRLALAAGLLLGAGVGLPAVRHRWRAHFYQGLVAEPPAFDLHRIDARASLAAPLWSQLDAQPGQRIAVAPAWYALGQHWYLYPLLGERLQHRVLYVPPTRDGAPVDLRDTARFEAALDEEAWLGALDQRAVDLVYVMVPPPVEERWILSRPERFHPLVMWNERDPALVQVVR